MEDTLMHPAPLVVMDYVGPALGALLFVAVMSIVAEPTRRTLNAIVLAGASGVYLSGGFGLWELTYPVIGAAVAFGGLRSYRVLGVGWLVHAGWGVSGGRGARWVWWGASLALWVWAVGGGAPGGLGPRCITCGAIRSGRS